MRDIRDLQSLAVECCFVIRRIVRVRTGGRRIECERQNSPNSGLGIVYHGRAAMNETTVEA